MTSPTTHAPSRLLSDPSRLLSAPSRLLSAVAVVLLCACQSASAPSPPPAPVAAGAAMAGGGKAASAASAAPAADSPSPSTDPDRDGHAAVRRVIRNAELGLEADDLPDTERKVTTAVASLGGFVLNSEHHAAIDDDGVSRLSSVSLTLRVPEPQFDGALNRIRALGTGVAREKTTGQDVTEEFVDTEARLKAQRAVEEQLLSILKQAKSVHDALEVQIQLGVVRTTIEQIEGRRRFLENQTSLSTIAVEIDKRRPLVSASRFAFMDDIKHAGGDVLNVGAGIVTALIRAVGVLAPVFLLLLLPGWFVGRAIFRRVRAARLRIGS